MECFNEYGCEKLANSERLVRLTDDRTNVVEANDLLNHVKTYINKYHDPMVSLQTSSEDVAKSEKKQDDFYSRLRNMYNKPLTLPVKNEKVNSVLSETFSQLKPITLEKPKGSTKKNNNRYPIPKPRRINLLSPIDDEIFCKGLDDDPELRDISEKHRKIKEESKPTRCPVPSLKDLPDDEEELEKLLKSYIADIKPSWKRHSSGKPHAPGTKESVRNIDYRLADLPAGKDVEKAVTGGEIVCGCPETAVIDGDVDSANDIDSKLDILQSNHKIAAVTIRVAKKQSIKESVDTKSKAQKYKDGPALLTKYCLERVCEKVAAHPKLSKLSVEGVPLSQPCQAVLVPSFATLRELKLISNKLGDEGVKTICRYVWRSGSLRVLDFSDNQIGPGGVSWITALLERRGVLRMLEPEFFGVERLTLNGNPIKYDGFKELLNAAGKDLWLKALDLRDCELRLGGEEALHLVTGNRQLEVLDLRGNNLKYVGDVVRTVLRNCPIDKAEYEWQDKEDLQKYLI